jgi:hypothetical protein
MRAAYDNARSGLPMYLLATEIIGYGGHDFAFAPYGAYWRVLRKLCTLELLSARKVRQLAPIGDSETMSLVREIRRHSCSRGQRRRPRLGSGGDVLPVVSRVVGRSRSGVLLGTVQEEWLHGVRAPVAAPARRRAQLERRQGEVRLPERLLWRVRATEPEGARQRRGRGGWCPSS